MPKKDKIQQIKDQYDSKEFLAFHEHILGGKDIHTGIYKNEESSVEEAREYAVVRMTKKLPPIKKGHKILIIGSGYGETARFLAGKYKCKIDCLDISEKLNEINQKRNEEAELDDRITVATGSFEKIPFQRETYDIVWSQDALYHSSRKQKTFREIARVLKPGGRLIFTDLMQTDECPEDALKDALSYLTVEKLGTVKQYRRLARKADLERVISKEMPEQLLTHLGKTLELTKEHYDELAKKTSKAFADRKIAELEAWTGAGKKGCLNWGILQFQKRNI